MHIASAQDLWERCHGEGEVYRLRCVAKDHEITFDDGVIQVRTIAGAICTAWVVWHHGYGKRALERGPYAFVHAQIGKILRNGPAFGPVHEDHDHLRFVSFDSDQSRRATRPHGELRIKPFLSQHVLLFVPDGGVRLLAVSSDPTELEQAVETYGPRWASATSPRFAVRFQGKHRELQVSNRPSELAYHEVDDDTRFSLVPFSLPEGGRPAMAALDLVRNGEAQRVALVPFDAEADVVVIWSDEQSSTWDNPEAPASGEQPSAAPSSPRASTGASASGPVPPDVWALVKLYVGWAAERPGEAKSLREQISPLLRAVERGANVSGWGMPLRRELERVGGFKFSKQRTFCHFTKWLKDQGILARPYGRGKCEFVFAEFHRPDSLAVARLRAWAENTLGRRPDTNGPRDQEEGRTGQSCSGTPSSRTPSSRTPPTMPPPTPGREPILRTAPTTSPSPSPGPSTPEKSEAAATMATSTGDAPKPKPPAADPFGQDDERIRSEFLFLKPNDLHPSDDFLEEDVSIWDGPARGPPDEE